MNKPYDKWGWPIRQIDGVRVCARPDCSEEEFRIDGYCSCECRDYHDFEQEIAALEAWKARAEKVIEAARHAIGNLRLNLDCNLVSGWEPDAVIDDLLELARAVRAFEREENESHGAE